MWLLVSAAPVHDNMWVYSYGGAIVVTAPEKVYSFLVIAAGVWGTEVRGGGFPSGYELHGPFPVSRTYEEESSAAVRSCLHVPGVQTEGDDPAQCWQALHLHRQLHHISPAVGTSQHPALTNKHNNLNLHMLIELNVEPVPWVLHRTECSVTPWTVWEGFTHSYQ